MVCRQSTLCLFVYFFFLNELYKAKTISQQKSVGIKFALERWLKMEGFKASCLVISPGLRHRSTKKLLCSKNWNNRRVEPFTTPSPNAGHLCVVSRLDWGIFISPSVIISPLQCKQSSFLLKLLQFVWPNKEGNIFLGKLPSTNPKAANSTWRLLWANGANDEAVNAIAKVTAKMRQKDCKICSDTFFNAHQLNCLHNTVGLSMCTKYVGVLSVCLETMCHGNGQSAGSERRLQYPLSQIWLPD